MPLQPDDTVCYCFHVSLRKIETFCRVNQPQVASQISDCLSAGTGCGWCVPMLKVVHRRMMPNLPPRPWDVVPEDGVRGNPETDPDLYATQRQRYLAERKQPPAAE
jgi:bacterioferritin-associated ferredoxin